MASAPARAGCTGPGRPRQGGGPPVSEGHVDRPGGLTLLPVRTSVPIELGWSGFAAKLARLPRVLTLWAGREGEIVAVNLRFDDEGIVRTHPARAAAPARRATESPWPGKAPPGPGSTSAPYRTAGSVAQWSR